MRPLHAPRTALLGAFIAFAFAIAPARGAFVATETSSMTQLASSTYLYSYTVSVAATSTDSASEFDLSLGAPIDPNSIVSPSNFFTFYTPGDPFITFTAFDTGAPFVGISPGSSGTFSFISSFAPSVGSFQASGLDPSFTLASIQGSALVPNVVPEPSSLLLAGVGIGGALGLSSRIRRRRAAAAG